MYSVGHLLAFGTSGVGGISHFVAAVLAVAAGQDTFGRAFCAGPGLGDAAGPDILVVSSVEKTPRMSDGSVLSPSLHVMQGWKAANMILTIASGLISFRHEEKILRIVPVG